MLSTGLSDAQDALLDDALQVVGGNYIERTKAERRIVREDETFKKETLNLRWDQGEGTASENEPGMRMGARERVRILWKRVEEFSGLRAAAMASVSAQAGQT